MTEDDAPDDTEVISATRKAPAISKDVEASLSKSLLASLDVRKILKSKKLI